MSDMDWIETHYEVVAFIEKVLNNGMPYGLVGERYEEFGSGGMYDLSKDWTDEFQALHGDRVWDGEWLDELHLFLTSRNNMELAFTHVVGNRVSGTSWHDNVVRASVNELTKVLGEPSVVQNDGRDKTNYEWWMQTSNGDVFTVYDWKEYRRIGTDEVIEWHVGGHSRIVTDRVASLIGKEVGR